MPAEAPIKLDDFLSDLAEHTATRSANADRAYHDLVFYSEYVMSFDNPEWTPNSDFLVNIYKTLQENHLSDRPEDVLVLGPRGSAKSTAVTVTFVTWAIGRNPLIRILLSFASLDAQGRNFVRQIKHIIEHNERYKEVFGDLYPGTRAEKWADTEFIVRRPTPPSGLKDPTVVAVGLGSRVPSKRADLIIGDDLVNETNAYTPTGRSKVIGYFMRTLSPVLVPTGYRIVVGSRWDPGDLYTYVARRWRLKFPKKPTFSVAETLLPLLTRSGDFSEFGADNLDPDDASDADDFDPEDDGSLTKLFGNDNEIGVELGTKPNG